MTLVDLPNEPEVVPPGVVADALYRMVLDGSLYIDLHHHVVDDAKGALVYLDEDAALAHQGLPADRRPAFALTPVTTEVGARLDWDGRVWAIVNVGQTKVTLQGEGDAHTDRPVVEFETERFEGLVAAGSLRGVTAPLAPSSQAGHERLDAATSRDQAEANRRWHRIVPVVDGLAQALTLSRSEQRWLRGYRAEERRSGLGYAGLLPRPRPGNRSNHAVVVPDEVINAAIDAEFAKPTQPSRLGFIRRLLARLQDEGYSQLPSARRCRNLLRNRKTHEQDLIREGFRAAYASQPMVLRLSATTPQHGTRPWEVAHIDHTLLDLQLCDSENPEMVLGRPWLTLVMDSFTRRVLAFLLSFDPPSYRSNMMALRMTVKRWNRLPETIVSDGGSDFESVHYETLLAATHITKKTRPPAESRFGSVIERLFGVTNTLFIHELTGNTKASKKVRTMTPAVDPARLAAWDLGSLDGALSEWFHEVYDDRVHPALGRSPRLAYTSGLELAGSRPKRYWAYDDAFVRLSLPGGGKATLTVNRRLGLRFRGGRYWNDAFKAPRLDGRAVEYTYDPWDVRYLLAHVDGSWIRCDAPAYVGLPAVSEREVKLAATELDARRQVLGRTARATDLELGNFLRDLDAHGELLAQRRKDHAFRELAGAAGVMATPESGTQLHGLSVDRGTRAATVPAEPESLDLLDLLDLEEYR